MTTLMRKIEQVAARPDYRLSVVWTDGQQMIIDLSHDVKSSGVWQSLIDPAKFQAVRVSENRYAIEWPDPADEDGEPLIDIDSDGLFMLAINQIIVPNLGTIMEKLSS